MIRISLDLVKVEDVQKDAFKSTYSHY